MFDMKTGVTAVSDQDGTVPAEASDAIASSDHDIFFIEEIDVLPADSMVTMRT